MGKKTVMRSAAWLVGLLLFGVVSAQDHNQHEGHGEHGGEHGADRHAHHHHNMTLDRDGMTMNSNSERLPEDCAAVSGDITIEVQVGREFARANTAFGFDQHEWRVPPCSRLHVTLHNQDNVRHQWMVHGLPRYLYPQGMFHLETAGRTSRSGSLIVPSDDRTYLVHCDVAQHMEKGLKAQLIVGAGDGALPSIPGTTAPRMR